MLHEEEREMSLTGIFARALAGAGLHPQAFAKRQLIDAIVRSDDKLAARLLRKYPGAPLWYARNDSHSRVSTLFELALDEGEFSAARAMVRACPETLTRDYSMGEVFINRSILMQRCIMSEMSEEIAFLLDEGMNVKLKDDDGNTALHFAAARTKPVAAALIANARADVNAANKNGETPLMKATAGDSDGVVKVMLGHGADIAVCDAAGLNATMHAIRNQNIAAATFLMQNGGKVLDQDDAAVERIRTVATDEAEWDFLRLLNSQYDVERNRQERLAQLTMKEICETGTAQDIRVKPIRLKPGAPAGHNPS